MANYDKQMAERVWQRVQGSTEQEKLNLRGMIQEELTAAAAYHQLARQIGGRDGELLQRMAREEQSHADCLRGIHKLTTGESVAMKMPRPVPDRPQLQLRRAYAGELKAVAAYDALRTHGEYGHVFAALGDQEREHSRRVLEILGRLEGSN